MARREINITQGKILPNLIKFCIPIMFSGVLQLLFNAVDVIVVGKFAGNESLAAVSSTSPLINLFTNLFIGLSVGCNVIVSRGIGSEEPKKVHEAVHSSITLGLLGGLFLTILGFTMSHQMLIWMDCPADVIEKSSLYLKIYMTCMPALTTYNFGAAILRSKGDTKRPLYFLMVAGVLNVIMNLIFVIPMHMDVAGVALASSLSQYVSAFLVINCLVQEQSVVRLWLKDLKIYKDATIEICKIGIPAGIQGMIFSISNVVIQSSINSFGSIVMAGNGAASNIEGFIYTAMQSFSHGCLTFVGQNIGARKKERILPVTLCSILGSVLTGLILGIGAWTFGSTLVAIYSDDPAVIAAGCVRLSFIAKTYGICGVMDIIVSSLRGLGWSLGPVLITLIGVCGYRLLWIAYYFPAHRFIETVYISYPISWIVATVALVVMFIFAYTKFIKSSEK